MPTTSSQRLATNMQALAHALSLAEADAERVLEVKVDNGVQLGPRQRRQQNTGLAPRGGMSLEYEPGKPLKNFGRSLAWDAGIPLPYNMQQTADAAEQAALEYENETRAAGDMFKTFDSQMQDNIDKAPGEVDKRVYTQYRELGAQAMGNFFTAGASDEQRSGALAQLDKINTEARGVLAADANEHAKFVRGFLTNELGTSRAGLASIDSAEKERVFSMESELARLDAVEHGSVEEQVVLRDMLGSSIARTQGALSTALKAAGTVAGAAGVATGQGYAALAGAGLGALGAITANREQWLDRNVIVKMLLEQHDTLDAMTAEFRPQVVALHEQVVADANKWGIPGATWQAPEIKLATPYTDAWRNVLTPQGESRTPNAPSAPTTTEDEPTAANTRAAAALAAVPAQFRGEAPPEPVAAPPPPPPQRLPVRGVIDRSRQ